MPKKKRPKQLHPRFSPAEMAAIEDDRKSLPGVAASASAYARHAVLQFPKLRKLEEGVRVHGREHGGHPEWLDALLAGVGL